MLIFYAPSTGGFYNSVDHFKNLPEDAIEISEEVYRELFAAPFLNKCIESDGRGRPVLSDLPVDRTTLQGASEKKWRDAQLSITDRLVIRDRDEMDDGGATTLDQTQYLSLIHI